MSVFDHVFLGLMVLSVLLGLWRGLVSEVFALIGWLVAVFIAWHVAPFVAPYLETVLETVWMRWPLAFLLVFVLIMMLLALLRFLLRELISISGLSVLDRFAGAGFGVLRALVLALLVVAGAGMTALPKEVWWRESMFAPPLATAVIAAKPWLPRDLAERIKY